ncbi:hypothetical protein A9R01_01595 ['Osedax' symbiont bacterium Rs2_46_30_T18]|nr:hypothetical protein A9R01_01595 ['Osedax' symbiont bacterium Rs2_46_30_T18]
MADYLHYFFDLHSGYKDATRYSQGLLALLDVSGTSIAQRLINAGYGKNDYLYKKGLLHINSYSKTTAVTHKHAVVIDDGSEVSVIFVKNTLSMRACIARIISDNKSYLKH